ncbi:hypothetical protein L6452_09643 [Arctium lappa]|uniref:Uncharacterized protein n=1 Tax=Arctium lappa TaxID=4217 RepID=A0ACB9DLM0_ARCLA|nr:hypothetical protein L6452_09643 [Arctium lappa]
MDLEDEGWVNIPYDGLLQVHDDGGNKLFSRKYVRSPKNLFKMDYFNSSRKSQEFVEEDSRSRNQLIPLPIQMDDRCEEEVKEIIGLPVLINGELKEAPEADLDPVFQVFFKKENEFVEMKMDSLRSSPRGISLPHIETDMFQYEDKSDDDMSSKVGIDEVEKVIHEEGHEGLNLWKKWGVNGIGAFCSFGMAAATICIILLGSGQRHKQRNQKIRIQIFSDDKRIKQVVHRANEAMSAMRGVPLSTAHITYGGYYEPL